MKKATVFGMALRRIRLEKNEPMKHMADRLGISTAFLSAVELGNKKPPSNLLNKLVASYELNATEREELDDLLSRSGNLDIKIPIANLSSHQQDLAVGFARRGSEPSMAELKKLFEDLNIEP